MAAAAERALRDELDGLARKKEQLRALKRQNDRVLDTRESLFTRMNSGENDSAQRGERRRSGGSASSGGDRRPGRQGVSDSRPLSKGNQRRQSDGHPRLQSSVAKPRGANETNDSKENGSSATGATPAAQAERRRAVAPHTGTEGLARSRRMFGALMGHLGKAKAMIEKDSSLIQRQTSKQQEAEQKEKEQSKALEAKVKRESALSKLETLLASTEIEMKEKLARTKLQHLQQTRTGASLASFLQTVSSPPIYYLPTKHTKETEDLVAASVEAFEAKKKASQQQHEVKLREVESEYLTKIEKYKAQLEELQAGPPQKDEQSDTTHREALKDEEEGKVSHDEAMEDDDKKDSTRDRSPSPPSRGSSPCQVAEATAKRKRSPSEEMDEPEVKKTRSEEPRPSDVDMAAEVTPIPTAEAAAEVDAEAPPDTEPAQPADQTLPSVPEDRPATPPIDNSAHKFTTPQKQKRDLSALRVTDLREELKKRGLDVKGVKAKLVKRLEEAMSNE